MRALVKRDINAVCVLCTASKLLHSASSVRTADRAHARCSADSTYKLAAQNSDRTDVYSICIRTNERRELKELHLTTEHKIGTHAEWIW